MRARVVVGMLILVLATLPVLAQPVATESLSATSLSITPRVSYDEAVLRVSGPFGYHGQKSFRNGESIQVDLSSFGGVASQKDEAGTATLMEIGSMLGTGVMPDGRYNFEVTFLVGSERVGVYTRAFIVEGGVANQGSNAAGNRENPTVTGETSGDDGGGLTEITAADDAVNVRDTQGDDSTHVFLENDTLPSNWWLQNEDGNLRFREYDGTSGGVVRMNIEQGSGQVGIGTTAPAVDLHIAGGGDIRSETSAATWQLQNGGDWAVNLIDDGSGTSVNWVLNLEDDENPGQWVRGLGIFEPDPLARLHVNSPGHDGTAKILVTEENGTVTGRTLFELQNNGNVQFFFQNTDSGDLWQMSQLSSVFQISSPSGSGKFRVRKGGGLQALNGSTTILDLNATGDLTVKSVTETSSRSEKRGFESVDGLSVLEKVAALPISEWSYKADNPSVRHLGPMSEDFHTTFGLGKSDKGITSVDTSGVALAAIQGLNQKLAEKDARIQELELRLLELEELVQALAEH